jgi:MFS family permease
MYPPERRARGISYVLVGAVFGAILGPLVFSPMFAGQDVKVEVLTVPWLAAGGISLLSLAIVMLVRPDTRTIAQMISTQNSEQAPAPAAPLAEIIRRPGVIPAMLASLASFGVMVSVMNLTGYMVVQEHHHSQDSVFPIVGAHVLGMYALVLVIGALIDRLGRTPALAAGLLVMGASRSGCSGSTVCPPPPFCCSGSASGGTSRSSRRPRRWPTGRVLSSAANCSASTT